MSSRRETVETVLVVDDEEPIRFLFRRFLEPEGYRILVAESGSQTLEIIDSEQVDLVLLDMVMPDLDGIETLRRIREIEPTGSLPVVMVSGHADRRSRLEGFEAGCDEFLAKPVDKTELLLRVKNLLTVKIYHDFLHSENEQLSKSVRERTLSLRNAMKALRTAQEDARLTGQEAILRLSKAAEFRAPSSEQHVIRMGLFGALIGEKLGWSSKRIELFRLASAMHDIGMVAVPSQILNTPEKLSDQEFVEVQKHCETGYSLLQGSGSELLQLAAELCFCHHERLDGSGYPRGLKGEEISIEGRVCAIADVYDSLTSDRTYRPAFAPQKAVEFMRKQSASGFDEHLLDLFFESSDKIQSIRERYTQSDAS